jgi:hypothetical protein
VGDGQVDGCAFGDFLELEVATWLPENGGMGDSGEVGGGYGDGGDGGGFRAEDARAEGYRSPLVMGEERYLFGSPAAFRAYGKGVGESDWGRVYIPSFAMGLRRRGHSATCAGVRLFFVACA